MSWWVEKGYKEGVGIRIFSLGLLLCCFFAAVLVQGNAASEEPRRSRDNLGSNGGPPGNVQCNLELLEAWIRRFGFLICLL